MPLEQFLRSQEGIKTVVVNPAHVKKSKSLDDNSPTVQQWLDKYFPEFYLVFKNWEGKAALAVLKEIPLPSEIAVMSPEGIVEIFKKGAERAVGIKRAKQLRGAALKTIGLAEGVSMAKIEIINLMEQYELINRQQEELEGEIEKILKKVPGAKEMETIKGVGAMTVAGFISEVGDIRKYSHPRQIQKLAGLNLVENSSGKHKGHSKISKRGRSRLRALLYRVMMPLIAKNEEFKQLHKYYITRSKNPLKKKQSLIALACKLIRVLYALGKKQKKYDGKKLMKDITRNQELTLQEAA